MREREQKKGFLLFSSSSNSSVAEEVVGEEEKTKRAEVDFSTAYNIYIYIFFQFVQFK